MKVLGISEVASPGGYGREEAYIVEITRSELMKVADKAAYYEGDKFPKLKVGETYPIADGFDFRNQIVAACKAMTDAHEKFASATQTMTRFVRLLPETRANDEGCKP